MLTELENQMAVVRMKCTAKFGFICTAEILYGHMQFKNGTMLSIKGDDVMKYCDPNDGLALDQANCLIVLKNSLDSGENN